jgi:hypothetical protein
MNGTRVAEHRGERRRRVTVVQRRRTSVRQSRPVPRLPRHSRLAWYAGLAVMAAVEVIEWPLALLMMLGHEIAHRAHSEALRDFAEGVESGA